MAECKKNAGESNADSVDVTDIEVDGDTATANVAVTGSSFDGQTLAVSLVKEDGAWKLDRFEDFVSFDQQKFADAFTSEADQQGQLTSKQVQCISSNIESADPSAVKQAILSGDGTAVSSLLFAGC